VTVAEVKLALERGRPVVLVRPPAVEQVADLWELIAPETPGRRSGVGPAVLIICADDASAAEWAGAAPATLRTHAATGLARTIRILTDHPVDVLAGGVDQLGALVHRAALKLGQVSTVLVAWPETLVAGAHAAALDTLLAEARDARRVVLSWNLVALRDFLERHAHRALVVGTPPVDDAGAPLPPACKARYAIVPPLRRSVAARDALNALNAVTPLVWNGGPATPPPGAPPPDAVLCVRLPTRDELAALARIGPPVVLVTASQLPYLRSIATAAPLDLPSGADRGRDRADALRERVSRLLTTTGTVDAELALLDPLFERFDPAEVAAALLALFGEGGRGKAEEAPRPLPPDAVYVKVFVNVGKKDRAAAKDLVGALIREAGVAKADIGRIDVRETFSLVEVAAGAAEQAVRGLAGVAIRGRRVLARLDREA